MTRLTREWVRKAESDWAAIIQLASVEARPQRDPICFHCQQAAEKYLKALLQEAGLPISRIHNLENLLANLSGLHPSLNRMRRGLRFLTDFAVDSRYPGKNANNRQMNAAIRWAERVRHECRSLLGIKPSRRRKKP